MAENSLKQKQDTKPQVQDALYNRRRIKVKTKTSPMLNIVKLLKIKK